LGLDADSLSVVSRAFRHEGAAIRRPALFGAAAFVVAFAADLVTKAYYVAHGADPGIVVVYNNSHAGDFSRRLTMSVLALAVTYLFARLALWRAIGRIWGAWICASLLVAGILGNGVSPFIWDRGVPDFISVSDYVWNLADFEIVAGLLGAPLFVAAAAVLAYARDRRGSRAA
jgi:lipoprotein signal peptidase